MISGRYSWTNPCIRLITHSPAKVVHLLWGQSGRWASTRQPIIRHLPTDMMLWIVTLIGYIWLLFSAWLWVWWNGLLMGGLLMLMLKRRISWATCCRNQLWNHSVRNDAMISKLLMLSCRLSMSWGMYRVPQLSSYCIVYKEDSQIPNFCHI